VMAALAVVPSPAVTAGPLYLIEDHLACLIETAELVSPEQNCVESESLLPRDRLQYSAPNSHGGP